MSRKNEPDGELRGCPTCGTRVAEADLGLRDYRWVNEVLPEHIGLMDIDGCLSQYNTGRVLMLELKPRGARVSTGARLTFALFVLAGMDVWVVWDIGKNRVKVGVCNEEGRVVNIREMTRDRCAKKVLKWWNDGLGTS